MRIQRTRLAAIAVMISLAPLVPITTFSQRLTIPEIAAASSEKVVTIGFMRDEFVTPLEELSRQADVVLDARLVHPHGYLSSDGMKIDTDYEIVPNRFLRSQIGDVSARKTPGPQGPLRLTVPGGAITVAGKTVISSFGMQKPIKAGSRYLIFATRVNPSDNRFVATGGSGGIFEVLDNGHLNPVLRTSQENPDFDDASFDDVARKVQSAPGRSR